MPDFTEFINYTPKGLLLNRSANRAGVCTRAAADALVSVDNVLAVTLGNARNGASISASAAANALVSNLVCHVFYLQNKFVYTYFIISLEKIKGLERKSL